MSSLPPVPSPLAADPLRAALEAAGYTASGVAELLGPVAERALSRGEPAAARLVVDTGGDLGVLVRLFLLAEPVAEVDAERALGGRGRASGVLVEEERGVVRAAVDIRPYGDGWWVASDLRSPLSDEPLDPETVVGIGAASVTLVTATPRVQAGRTALDLGTGCGVQALHLAAAGLEVTATDSSPRALEMAALTAALSGVEFELVEGNLFEAVAGRSFDQIVANPPFVIGPNRFTYRDSALPGDGLTAAVVAGAVEHLEPGGTATLMASWIVGEVGDWRTRVFGWLPDGCDALVVLREQLDPAEHVALWLADGAEEASVDAPDGLAEQWLLDLAEQKTRAVAYGLVVLRRLLDDDAEPVVSLLDLQAEPETPAGPRVLGWLDRVDALRAGQPLDLRLAKAPGLQLTRRFGADDEGWAPAGATLAAPDAVPAQVDVDDLVVALVKECEPELPLRAVLELVGAGTGNPHLAVDALPAVLALVEAGLLVPVDTAPVASGAVLPPA
ncbi:MAG: hypothetical protein QOC80_857 [Frankiaceae bacterium]|nr:hypothetical protein [Frankiaceae bacterium]